MTISQTLLFGLGEMIEMLAKGQNMGRKKSRRPTLRLQDGRVNSERLIELLPQNEPLDLGQEIIKKKIEEFKAY